MGRKYIHSLIPVMILILVFACSHKIEQPTNLPEPGAYVPDTTYVMVSPAWTEAGGIAFNRPSDVKIGYDRYIYVADKNNNRIVKLNPAGEFIESYAAVHPTQVTQDRALDLLAVSDSNQVMRRSYADGGDFQVVYTAPDITLPPPSEGTDPAMQYGIAASPYPDKKYFVSNYYENRIYEFSSGDVLFGVEVPSGNGPGYASAPICVNSFDFKSNYYVGYTNGRSYYAIQLINGYTGQPIIPFSDSSDIYLTTVGGHKDISLDELGNIFVSMSATSEVWKFSRMGVFRLKFGQDGESSERLDNPRGIDVWQDYIYVADTDNDRIVRFLTSTSPQQ